MGYLIQPIACSNMQAKYTGRAQTKLIKSSSVLAGQCIILIVGAGDQLFVCVPKNTFDTA